MTLLFISFIAGVLTVISPCVLPLLPVIVGGTLAGGTNVRRAVTVTASLAVSVFAFTFLLKVSTALINVPQSFWSILSGALIILVGLATLFPKLYDNLPFLTVFNRDSNKLMSGGYMRQSFWGDVIVGAALGPVFSSCSPTYFIVLASVLPASLALGVADILAYVVGLALFLFVITFAGQKLVGNLSSAADPNAGWRKVLGVLLIATGILIITGYAATIEAPLYGVFDETKIEQNLLSPASTASSTSETTTGSTTAATMPSGLTIAEKMQKYHLAPELQSPDAYLNTNGQPISLAQYRGKDVVLVDFWTYSCINCIRTLPYVESWYQKYQNQGLVVIGVHTPEFAFEHVESNVAAALKQFGITYPVVLDNEYKTWDAFGNQYWPHEYLIDIDGFIVHDNIGEGGYAETEEAIQAALAERAERLGTTTASIPTSITPNVPSSNVGLIGSPETYFGSNRNQYFGNGTPGVSGTNSYTVPVDPGAMNTFYLGGSWDIEPEYAQTAGSGDEILYQYNANNIYIVAAADHPVTVKVLRDGVPVPASVAGADLNPTTSTVTIQANRLYSLITDPNLGGHVIELEISDPGLQAYTFTFG